MYSSIPKVFYKNNFGDYTVKIICAKINQNKCKQKTSENSEVLANILKNIKLLNILSKHNLQFRQQFLLSTNHLKFAPLKLQFRHEQRDLQQQLL